MLVMEKGFQMTSTGSEKMGRVDYRATDNIDRDDRDRAWIGSHPHVIRKSLRRATKR